MLYNEIILLNFRWIGVKYGVISSRERDSHWNAFELWPHFGILGGPEGEYLNGTKSNNQNKGACYSGDNVFIT